MSAGVVIRMQPFEAAVPILLPGMFTMPWKAIWPGPPMNSLNTRERALVARANG